MKPLRKHQGVTALEQFLSGFWSNSKDYERQLMVARRNIGDLSRENT